MQDRILIPVVAGVVGWGAWVTRKCFLASEAMERVARIEAKLDRLIDMHMNTGKKTVLRRKGK